MEEKKRKTGIDIIGNVPWGTHFCQFYQTKEDLIDILVPYFKAGLENNEFCMWVTSEPLNEKEAEKAMRGAVPDLDQYLKKGQIEIVPYIEWYLKDGVFNLQRVLNAWIDKLNQALAKGYDGIRVTGNTAWLETRDWKTFADYEEQVDGVIGKYQMISICTYSLDKCGATEVIDVVKNHQFALIKREGKWELIESSERKWMEKALQVSNHFLEITNQHREMTPLLKEFVAEVKQLTGCAAVGLRILGEEGSIPYQAYEGFSREFYELESPLSTKSDQCMCINVIKGITDPKLPFFTEGGSFYINGATRFLATASEEEKGKTRNACNEFGYESVGLVPIRLRDRILGLIHMADPRENMVPLEMVEVLEDAAMQLGTAIQRVWVEEEIIKKNKELEAFVYMVSHDLKNPVVSIQGFCNLLLKNHKGDLNEKAHFYIERVQANASLMASLLEDLLELSRIGRIEDVKREISVQEVIKSVWAGVSRSFPAIDVEFVLPEKFPQVFHSEKRLYQIFYNLLSNAVKFKCEDKPSRVEIGYQDNNDNYTFFVRDNGIGIDKKYYNKIFELFSQLKESESEGTGVGLAIVKKIVETNQGKVWVQSQKGTGSTFYFTIPKKV